MSRRAQAARPLLVGLCCAFFGCTVPPLESQFEGGPTVKDIVNNINCELKSIVNQNNPEIRARLDAESQLDPPLPYERRLSTLLNYLTEAHFVASVLMTLDVLDTQGVNPSLSFITPLYPGNPLSAMTNSTLAIGGSLSGTQERNITLSYSIDLESVRTKCPMPDDSTWRGLVGDLGLTKIVVDGLRGLDAASDVNVYGNSGPTALTVSDTITGLTLEFNRSKDERGDGGISAQMNFNGNMSFSPSTTDPKSPGTATFTGTAKSRDKDKKDRYFISLNGATLQEDPNRRVSFSLTGTMSRLSPGGSDLANALGFGPKLSLAGHIGSHYEPATLDASGTAAPDLNSAPRAITVAAKGNEAGSQEKIASVAAAGGGGASAGGGPQAKSGGASSGGSTQFGSLVNFIVSYGINGGPNWTLRRFKGPSGGGGSSSGGSGGGGGGGSQFLNFGRTDTDTLSITFVAACKTEQNTPNPKTYWDSLPHCDQYSKQSAANAGAANNLFLPFR